MYINKSAPIRKNEIGAYKPLVVGSIPAAATNPLKSSVSEQGIRIYKDIDECREMLKDALGEMILAYKQQKREIPKSKQFL